MRYILAFLFGAGCGAGGTLLWLRKDVKKELESREMAQNCDEVPFTVGEGTDSGNEAKAAVGPENGLKHEDEVSVKAKKDEKIAYHKIVGQYKDATSTILQAAKDNPVSVRPRDEDLFAPSVAPIPEIQKPKASEEYADCVPISRADFKEENGNEKEQYVYFRGDRIMSTENGTIIPNPAVLVGTEWEKYIGQDAERTAFIRNPNLVTDYEIYVEDGLYEDEFGTAYLRED